MSTPLNVKEMISERMNAIPEYVPESLEEVAQRLGLPVGQLIKLDANENPYGPTRHTLNVLNGYNSYHRYPDASSRRLRQAIGQYVDVDPEHIIVGNGSDELIDLVLRLFRPLPGVQGARADGIAEVLNCPPTFDMYAFYATTNDMSVLDIPRSADFHADVDAIVTHCYQDPRPRLLFLASPNNPDGSLLGEKDLLRLLDLPLLVVLDQAYVEFSSEGSWAKLVTTRNNLIVLRSFSKWAGLAGLRVGYGIFPEALMSPLRRLKSPFNVNVAAQAAACATLEDLAEARTTLAKIVAERQRLMEKLGEFPFLKVHESQANYLLCEVRPLPQAVGLRKSVVPPRPDIAELRTAMERRGIILRYYNKPGLANCVRISVGTPMQDEAVLLALRNLGKDITTRAKPMAPAARGQDDH
jgi:histidinol-phosphate aminotransferase